MQEELIAFLRQEVKPATGCTEPGAIALAAAEAAMVLGENPLRLKVSTSANIAKNAATVSIPNAQSHCGVAMAAALGLMVARPETGLELFNYVTPDHVASALAMLAEDRVSVEVDFNESLSIEIDAWGIKHHAHIRVAGGHNNIERRLLDGIPLEAADFNTCADQGCTMHMRVNRLSDIVEFVSGVPLESIEFLNEALTLNKAVMNHGFNNELCRGVGVGVGLRRLFEQGIVSNDLLTRVRVAVAAACDARMAGVSQPCMSFMGSGNQGIMASVPLYIVAEEMKLDREDCLRGLALSYLVTAMVKVHTGKLSPSCGCAVAAGVGVAAATAWMLGKEISIVQGAVNNLIGNLAGLLCDGAKASCSLKISTSACEAILAALLSINGVRLGERDGIVSKEAETTICNLGKLTTEGLSQMDRVLLGIINGKGRSL